MLQGTKVPSTLRSVQEISLARGTTREGGKGRGGTGSSNASALNPSVRVRAVGREVAENPAMPRQQLRARPQPSNLPRAGQPQGEPGEPARSAPARALSPSLSCRAQGPPKQGEPPAAAISCSPHGGEWPPRRGGGGGSEAAPVPRECDCTQSSGGGRAPRLPSSGRTLGCSLLRPQDLPSVWLQPLGLRLAKSPSGAEARTPRTLRTR